MMFDEPLSRHRGYISASISAPSFPTFNGVDSSPDRASSSSAVHFSSAATAANFLHNPRVALALVPAAAFLLDLGGTAVSAVLAVGLAVSYLLDSLRTPAVVPFFAIWLSLLLSQLAFFVAASPSLASAFSSTPLAALASLLSAETTFLLGVWCSLQFKWIRIENRPIAASLERLLFACIPVAAPAIFTWASIAGFGVTDATAYHFAALACFYYWVFSLPRAPSFSPVKHETGQILGPLESCVHTLYLLFAPLLFRIATHHAVLFSSATSVCDLFLLFFIPFLFQLYMAHTRGAMWWVTKDAKQVRDIVVTNGAIAVAVVVVCLEIRIVFRSFGKYLHVPPPLDYVLVTIAMLGGAASAGAYAVGLVEDAFGSVAFTAMAVLVSAAGLACIPIVALHFSHVQSAKRFLVLVMATGLLFIFMQPPITLSWAFHSTMINTAHQSSDDISIYGLIAAKPSWPSWLLILTVLLTLAAVTSIIPIKYIVELRAFYAIGVGITLGIYICAEYFFQAMILYPLLVATIVCASVFVVFTHLPSASSPKILPWVFALLVALFPVTYLLEGQLRGLKSMEEGEVDDKFTSLFAVEGARMALLGLYATLFMLIALEIKFELASLMREKATPTSSGLPPKTRLMHQRRSHVAPSFTIKRLSIEGAWMPAVGNVATALCFGICLILNISLTGGSNRAIFFLAPILLLLNQDSNITSGFGDRQRYFPVTLAISGYLVLFALYRIFEEVWYGDVGWGLQIGGPGWLFAVKNLALLLLALPNHILFNQFMWDFVKQTDVMLLLTLPLNLPSIVMTDIITVRVLGLLGTIYSLAQYLISRQNKIAGMKYI
ncbi:hypothetical protein QJS10_CPB22g00457 [Acorus calamus]|uniref:No exine formation 1 n=1 Tax=Acorus calamus TaxID=4465 RepID=A0AAV9BZ02_ACOCL|nr:hypothetical protein QJS10_CPB22g00457 [Acorus calamus]